MSLDLSQFDDEFDYIVVGSGAGGGTLAARLAESGLRVLVLEAGSDPKNAPAGTNEGDRAFPNERRLPDDYDVPVFHALSSENNAMQWDYFVRHYADQAKQERDLKFDAAENGIYYPRSGCLGGCTAHNAMIMVYPNNDDWAYIQQLTGDLSWSPVHMRKYFQRLEKCRHRGVLITFFRWFGYNPSRHGWKGWLQTEKSIPVWELLHDRALVWSLTVWVWQAFLILPSKLKRILWFFVGRLDPNDWRLVKKDFYGIHYPPLTTKNHSRTSTRERLLDVLATHPANLRLELNALVTRVIFNDTNRAIGVEFQKGERLYQAHVNPSQEPGLVRRVRASKEVILAGGAFNTPQLLMLSGVGPAEELRRHEIEVRVNLPGVGTNLQDRYEACVVNEMNFPHWKALEGATFSAGDPQYQEWQTEHSGVYTGNGAVIATIQRSFPERRVPDLFCFALLTQFYGYFVGYSKTIVESLNYLSWAVLKGHTNNRGGRVTLVSKDPRARPFINFHYFDEGTGDYQEDLDSVVAGLKFVRRLMAPLYAQGIAKREVLPGAAVQSDEQLRDYARYQTWGHHASCTCPIGTDHDPMAVLDGNFRVRGTHGLRVVDASVFPRIPGLFIVSAIYMIAEKAADVILADALADRPLPPKLSWLQQLVSICLFCKKAG